MHYYQFNIGDYAKHSRYLSNDEDLAYRRLLDMYYMSEQPLINDSFKLAKSIGMPKNVEEIESVLEQFFTLEDDGFHNSRADKEISEYRAKADTARANGKKGGRPRKTKQEPDGNPEKTQSVFLANQIGTGSKTNHKPLTINQEPYNKDHVADEQRPNERFDFDALQEIWNHCCESSDTPSTKCRVVSEKAKKSINATYRKYCQVRRKKGKEPSSRNDFLRSYFPAVLDRAGEFVGQEGEHKDWKPNLNYACRVDTYDQVLEWARNDQRN